jgi:hypothetical protein
MALQAVAGSENRLYQLRQFGRLGQLIQLLSILSLVGVRNIMDFIESTFKILRLSRIYGCRFQVSSFNFAVND